MKDIKLSTVLKFQKTSFEIFNSFYRMLLGAFSLFVCICCVCLCVCWVCLHMCVYVCVDVCMCVVDVFLNVCMRLCVEARVQCQLSSLARVNLHFTFWERVTHWNWSSPIVSDYLANEFQGSFCLCLPGWDDGCTGLCCFGVDVRGLFSGPQAGTAGTSLTELSAPFPILFLASTGTLPQQLIQAVK